MGIITDFFPRIVLENPPPAVWFLHPKRAIPHFRIDYVLQAILADHLKGPSIEGGQLEVLIEILGRFPNPKRNRGNPGPEFILAPTHRADGGRHASQPPLYFHAHERISSLGPFFLLHELQDRIRQTLLIFFDLQVFVFRQALEKSAEKIVTGNGNKGFFRKSWANNSFTSGLSSHAA